MVTLRASTSASASPKKTVRSSKPKPRKSRSKKELEVVKRNEKPTPDKWQKMQVYRSFVVSDSDGKEYKFEREDTVAILPNGTDPTQEHDLSKYWLAKIREIRAESFSDDSNSVWVKVQWFYSPKDVSDVIKSFDRTCIGKQERIFSDHYDYVEPEAFDGVISCSQFKEDDPEQEFIPDLEDHFYRRYTIEYRARNVQPKPGAHTCVCLKPYNPNDTDPLKVMHFCPRPSCRRAYHHSCLISTKSKESSSAAAAAAVTIKMPSIAVSDSVKVTRSARKTVAAPAKSQPRPKRVTEEEDEVLRVILPGASSSGPLSRELRLLACSPDTDESVDLTSLIPYTSQEAVDDNSDIEMDDIPADLDSPPAAKKRRGRPPKKTAAQPKTKRPSRANTRTRTRPDLSTVLATLPADLVTIACQPLVRGGAFRAGGVAGNIGFVTQARRLVYAALEKGGGYESVPDDWEDTMYGDSDMRAKWDIGLKNAVVKVEAVGSRSARVVPPFVCPECKSAI